MYTNGTKNPPVFLELDVGDSQTWLEDLFGFQRDFFGSRNKSLLSLLALDVREFLWACW